MSRTREPGALFAGRTEEGRECEYRRPPISNAARVRAEGEDFERSFEELRDRVELACDGHREWEAKVVAAIRAVVDFTIASPAKALALTVEARRPGSDDRQRADEVIAYFAERLADVAPREQRAPVSSDAAIVESMAMIVRGHLLSHTVEQLTEAAPDLVYLALVPYLGLAETRAWARALALGGM